MRKTFIAIVVVMSKYLKDQYSGIQLNPDIRIESTQ